MINNYYSNGKLLLTGEYLVLDGALSLAVPTQFGQFLTIKHVSKNILTWKSIDVNGKIWFEEEFSFEQITFPFLVELYLENKSHCDISKNLLKILFTANQLNKKFLIPYLETNIGIEITTTLDFSKNWGLGTSSTLINNIANWAKVDAYHLLEKTFGGSGYDIACAKKNTPITYRLENDNRLINEVNFNPNFKDNLYFVHLNKKQNSRDGIQQYKANKNNSYSAILEISEITSKIITCVSLNDFEFLITQHEQIISKIIKQKNIKALLFNDYNGTIKSLGAWGGDFILVTGNKESVNYFKNKGYYTIIPYTDMVLK